MAKRAPFPCAALGLVLLAASVEGILDAAPHSALRPGLRRREPVAMGLASVPSPPVPREPLGFIAGFDFDAFGKGLKDFALGGISGGIAQTIVFPIDLAKTRIQDEVVAAGAKAQYSGVFQTILKVAKDEGVLKLWRGVTPVLIGSTPECALEIGGNSVARQMLADKLKQPLDQLPFWAEFAAGGVGGFCQVIATCPMERVKILQQVLGDKGGSVSTIVSQIGLGGLYQGVKACYLRDISFAAIYFGIYHESRKFIRDSKIKDAKAKDPKIKADKLAEAGKLGPLDDLIAGLVAGVPASFVTCPLDVIKTRMQSCGVDANGCRIAVGSFSTTAGELWAEGQMGALFKGVYGRVGRVAPQMALTLVFYEALKVFFEDQAPPAASSATSR